MKVLPFNKAKHTYNYKPAPELWTVIIPAAGRGTRLGYDKPKILYPIAGRPILHWLIDLLAPHCQTFAFVFSPVGAPTIEPELKKLIPDRSKVFIQKEPRGMADAIYCAVPDLATPFTLVIWGDQVALHPETVKTVITMLQSNSEAMMSLPIVRRESPYVHYATDRKRNFTHVLEKREGAKMPKYGQSDCGLFAFKTSRLKEVFELEIQKGITYSQATKEWNFLPMLPQFDTNQNAVLGIRIDTIEETIGVNNTDEAEILETFLRRRELNGG